MERPGWRSTLPILALYLVGIGVIRQIELYAGDPDEERDCPVRYDGSPVAEAAVATVRDAPVDVRDRNGTINDASCLDRTPIFGVVRPVVEDDIRAALSFAREEGLRVSVAGRRHSMGGQAFFRDALILDMQSFNRMSLDEESGILRADWGDLARRPRLPAPAGLLGRGDAGDRHPDGGWFGSCKRPRDRSPLWIFGVIDPLAPRHARRRQHP